MVMLANNTGVFVGWLAGRFAGRIGHLFSPGAQRGPYPFVPYGLDNGAYSAFTHNRPWPEEPWLALLDWAKASGQDPQWVLVPDVVGDRQKTLESWRRYAPRVRPYGWPLAFAVQDGMRAGDVPADADVLFVGGTTEWKWETMPYWCALFPRVHVGRVNEYKALVRCYNAGAESVDGTGWMREPGGRQQRQLVQFLEEIQEGQCLALMR